MAMLLLFFGKKMAAMIPYGTLHEIYTCAHIKDQNPGPAAGGATYVYARADLWCRLIIQNIQLYLAFFSLMWHLPTYKRVNPHARNMRRVLQRE